MERQRYPRTRLYLRVLQNELQASEALIQKLPDSATGGELYRVQVVKESISELEHLLGVNTSGWSAWQVVLLSVVSLASLLSAGLGLWLLLSGLG